MANGMKCYCCGEKETTDKYYFCYECVKKLKGIFDRNSFEVFENPPYAHHCNSCGENENRRIVCIDFAFICNKCVEMELSQYEKKRTK